MKKKYIRQARIARGLFLKPLDEVIEPYRQKAAKEKMYEKNSRMGQGSKNEQ